MTSWGLGTETSSIKRRGECVCVRTGSVELERHGWLTERQSRETIQIDVVVLISILWNIEPNIYSLTHTIDGMALNYPSFYLPDIKYLFYHPDVEDSWENEYWITRPSAKPLMSCMDFQVTCSITSTESDICFQITGKQKKRLCLLTKTENIRAQFTEVNSLWR